MVEHKKVIIEMAKVRKIFTIIFFREKKKFFFNEYIFGDHQQKFAFYFPNLIEKTFVSLKLIIYFLVKECGRS